jgi:hypothetical protein
VDANSNNELKRTMPRMIHEIKEDIYKYQIDAKEEIQIDR